MVRRSRHARPALSQCGARLGADLKARTEGRGVTPKCKRPDVATGPLGGFKENPRCYQSAEAARLTFEVACCVAFMALFVMA